MHQRSSCNVASCRALRYKNWKSRTTSIQLILMPSARVFGSLISISIFSLSLFCSLVFSCLSLGLISDIFSCLHTLPGYRVRVSCPRFLTHYRVLHKFFYYIIFFFNILFWILITYSDDEYIQIQHTTAASIYSQAKDKNIWRTHRNQSLSS